MTVLQVCAYAAPYEGNFIKSLKALAEKLSEKNIKTVYTFPENARDIDWVKQLSAKNSVYFLPLAKARIKPATYQLLKRIYKKYPDLMVIHSHFELYDVPVALTAPTGVKVFWHLHDALEIYSSLRHRITHRVQYGLCYKNATLLSVSDKHMRYVLRCGFPNERAIFLPNGIDTNRIKIVSTEYEHRKYDFTIFGWEFERKGVDLCIEALLKSELQCKVAVVGSEDTANIIKDRFGTVSQIEVIEPVADINTLYADTKCFLHISRAEGLSYALLEAVYAGIPVICSDISENQFAVKFPIVTMVKHSNIDFIASAMEKQLSISKAEENYIQTSRKIIQDEYSVMCWVRNIMDQYGVEND